MIKLQLLFYFIVTFQACFFLKNQEKADVIKCVDVSIITKGKFGKNLLKVSKNLSDYLLKIII